MRAAVFASCVLLLVASSVDGKGTTFEITVPESVKPKEQDAYICTTLPLPDKPHKLVGVEPLGEQKVVHHILLFGCDVPFKQPKAGEQSVWECKSTPTCGGFQETIMYGWGRNAPKLDLPKGVGFSVGKGSAIAWVVAQVHYLGERPDGDVSGVRLDLEDTPVPFSAGLLSYASFFSIPPGKKSYLVQNNCCYRGFQPLTTFAVRVHTHTMGKQVFMTRPSAIQSGKGDIIAVGDPQAPQGFNAVQSSVIWPGEHLNVVCDFDSSGKTAAVAAGPTHAHEMCNMYLMVYSAIPHIEMCNNGASLADERSPGNMPRAAVLLPDPFPLWKPPKPQDDIKGAKLGQVASVALGPDGALWALHRGDHMWNGQAFDQNEVITYKTPIAQNVVVQMHPDTGKILRQWGAGHFFMPHMITVDRNNTVWIADAGRHQVLKFTASGKFIMAAGIKNQPGPARNKFCKPTEVAFMNDGSFLVADGYCNSRIVRFNPDGSHHSQYKLPDSSNKLDTNPNSGGRPMGVAHSVVLDECDGEVVLADRENMHVLRFDMYSTELRAAIDLTKYGKVWALTKGPYGRTFALCWSPGQDAVIVDVYHPEASWKLPNSTNLWPHDFVMGPAALSLTGVGDRLLAVYVAPLCDGCSPIQKYILFPQSFGAPDKDLAAPVVVPTTAQDRPVIAHIHTGHGGLVHPAQQAAAAAAVREQEGGDAATVDADLASDEITDAGEEQEEQQEEKVEQQEQQYAEQEVQDMQQPQTLEELQAKLAEAQEQLQQYQQAEGDDNEVVKTIHTPGKNSASRRGWAGMGLVVFLSVLFGVGVGAAAVHFLVTRGGAGYTRVGQGQQNGVHHAAGQQNGQSVDEMLRENDLELSLERSRLMGASRT
eukprot:GHUV01000535.1.p1 GENE.GHUV01000535.1~~GHUV01000535.1.p1  ORF type:complete len:875 (+),score=241.60 GHUV01000535.1:368-2992(+)